MSKKRELSPPRLQPSLKVSGMFSRCPRHARSRWRVSILLVTAFLAPLATNAPASAAYPNDVDADCDSSLTVPYRFSGPEWAAKPIAKSLAEDGIEDWNGFLDYNAEPLVTFENTTGVPSVQVYLTDDIGEGRIGEASCGGYWMKVNILFAEGLLPADPLIRDNARHEIAHIAGLNHTGDEDSFGYTLDPDTDEPVSDNAPTMGTCDVSRPSWFEAPSQDDVGSMTFSHSRLAGAEDSDAPLLSNFGFEQGTSYWDVTGTTDIVDYVTSGGATGPGHVRYKPGTTASHLYQRMAYSDAPSKKLIAVANHKRTQSTDTGSVRVVLEARPVKYGTPGCDEFTNGKDMNNRLEVGQWEERLVRTASPGTDWTRISTEDNTDPTKRYWTTFASTDSASAGNMDLRVAVYPSMTDQVLCAPTSVLLDNVRIECYASKGFDEADCT